MTTAPTAQEFLAQADPEEPDEDLDQPADPLESIATSLRVLADAAQAPQLQAEEQAKDDYLDLQREYEEIERLHDAKQQLIDDTLKICSKSTSKLANSIRALLEVPVTTEPAAEPDSDVPAHDADVEAWRAYARSRGYQGPDVDTANRSQIRTMLGIDHGAVT